MPGVPVDKLFLLGVFGTFSSVLLIIIGTATPNWIFCYSGTSLLGTSLLGTLPSGTLNRGLFKTCNEDGCSPITIPSDYEMAIRALSILGIIFGCMSMSLALVFVRKAVNTKPESKALPYISGALATIGGLMAFAGALIYEVDVYSVSFLGFDDYLSYNLGFSFVLNTTGSIILTSTGSLVMAGGSRMVRQGAVGTIITTVPVVYQAQAVAYTGSPQQQSSSYGAPIPGYYATAYPPPAPATQSLVTPPPYSEAVSQKY
ncbi:epithelial membrane protein 2 [Biomphalaria pfeifferi]|uniref:Epithelial membrane protein 2 n=1 Tax=Biomphalaria pfeifferi TaxID=112525 RepID=A0AAD8EVF1_BIOPF|nr:epithelial membrane protein 2 [Biomphalaria pfeifferi]